MFKEIALEIYEEHVGGEKQIQTGRKRLKT